MATSIYESSTIKTIDGKSIFIVPLKIFYLRIFMDTFNNVSSAKSEIETLEWISKCASVCMMQYAPELATPEAVEDSFDLKTVYKILDIGAGIKLDADSSEPVDKQIADPEKAPSWEKMDLAAIESEVFLCGIWKDFHELETSMSLPELVAIINSKRDLDYADKKFFAAIQGVDLDKQSGKKEEVDPWQAMKARVFSGGRTSNPNDVLALSGRTAQQKGFGIGQGLSYERW